MSTATLADILEARSGVVCALGAGGKKTTLYRLAAEHPGARVAVTSTVHIPPFPKSFVAETVIANEDELADRLALAADRSRVVAYACPTVKRGRHAGVPVELVNLLHVGLRFDVTLVKADGARARTIKSPADDEPQLPPTVDTVLLIVGARAIGAPLDERIAHRIERVAAVTGATPGETITVEHLARLFSSPDGLLKGVGEGTRIVPLINMVDDASIEAQAREVGRLALASCDRFDRVVLASMRAADPVVDVVKR